MLAYQKSFDTEEKFRQALNNLHHVQNLTQSEIADHLRMGTTSIYRYFQKFSIKARIFTRLFERIGFDSDADFCDLVAHMYHIDKLNLKEIGEVWGASYLAIRTYFELHKIKTRSPSESLALNAKEVTIPQEQQEIINGMLLGDGHIELKKRYISAALGYACNYSSILESIRENLPCLRFNPKLVKTQTGYRLMSQSYMTFTRMREKWYPNGQKIVPRDIELTPTTCYWWYLGDGSSANNSLKLYPLSFSLDDVEFLASKMPIRTHIYFVKGNKPKTIGKRYPYLSINKIDERMQFLEFIGRCQHPEYKRRWVVHTKRGAISF